MFLLYSTKDIEEKITEELDIEWLLVCKNSSNISISEISLGLSIHFTLSFIECSLVVRNRSRGIWQYNVFNIKKELKSKFIWE